MSVIIFPLDAIPQTTTTDTTTDTTTTTDIIFSTPTVWVDGDNGDDLNGDGSQTNPFKTVERCLQVKSTSDTIVINIDSSKPVYITQDIDMTLYSYKKIIFYSLGSIVFKNYNDGTNQYTPSFLFNDFSTFPISAINTLLGGISIIGGDVSNQDDGSGLPMASNQALIKMGYNNFTFIWDCSLTLVDCSVIYAAYSTINITGDGFMSLSGNSYLINSNFLSFAYGDMSSGYVEKDGVAVTDITTVLNNTNFTQL